LYSNFTLTLDAERKQLLCVVAKGEGLPKNDGDQKQKTKMKEEGDAHRSI
jgi:hypothetical protein